MRKADVRALETDDAEAAEAELDAAEAFAFDPARKRKEVKLGFSIAEGHLTLKVAQLRRFLGAGHRVDVVIMPGRTPHPGAAEALLARIWGEVSDLAKPTVIPELDDQTRAVVPFWPCSP